MLDLIGVIAIILWGAAMIAILLEVKGKKAKLQESILCWSMISVIGVFVAWVAFTVLPMCFSISKEVLILLTAFSLLLMAVLAYGGVRILRKSC